ncbi:TPA: hypothetical protein I4D94_23045 [Enterobacter asburiae]|nr:hypothetical protein CIG53_18790 [Enterobacter asburiae]RAY99823.1 hypothetical protein DP195_00015 [Enterobacter asburiae]HAS1942975.1 hypothetical protein [Enterobacter asburiae]
MAYYSYLLLHLFAVRNPGSLSQKAISKNQLSISAVPCAFLVCIQWLLPAIHNFGYASLILQQKI